MRPWCDRARLERGRARRDALRRAGRDAGPGPGGGADKGALALARVSLVERKVELEKKGAKWQAAVEGGPLQVGEALRTGPDAVARLELPWMALTLSPGSSLRFPDAFLLSATLDSGRALVEAPGLDALKIVTAEAEVRGQGRAVVRRQGRSTLVTCLAGRFFVEAAGSTVTLTPGRGTVVAAGRAPGAPQDVPAAPTAGPVARARPGVRRPRGGRWSCAGRAARRATSSSCCRWAPTWCCCSATSRRRP